MTTPTPTHRRGRRIAQAVYYLVLGSIALAATIQITQQVFFAPAPAAPRFQSCHQGLRALLASLDPAQTAAWQTKDATARDKHDEEAALRRYRQHLAPLWQQRDHVAELCSTDAADRKLLDAIERLRYSEEHGVRHEAAELTALRHQVQTLANQRLRQQ